jgi:hypothetical protein
MTAAGIPALSGLGRCRRSFGRAHPMCRSIGTSMVSRFMGQLMTFPTVRVTGSEPGSGLNGIVFMPPSLRFARVGTCVRHDADPVINPSADRAEALRLGRVVPARLQNARRAPLWAAAASFCLSVAISAASAAVRSTVITSVSRDCADCAFPLSGLAKIRITSGTCLRRGRADRAFTPSGFAKIFGDDAGVPSCHWSRCACSQIHTFTDPSIVAVGMHCRFKT